MAYNGPYLNGKRKGLSLMIEGLSIRPMISDEVEELSRFASRVYFESYAGQPEIDDFELLKYAKRSFATAHLRTEFAEAGSKFLLATMNDALVGFSKIDLENRSPNVLGNLPVYLARLYTTSTVHGSGVGQRLLDETIRLSRRNGGESMWLTVWELSSRARRFYERNGFRVVGTSPFFLGGRSYTDLIMEKPI